MGNPVAMAAMPTWAVGSLEVNEFSRPGQRGFTLLELLVVLAIVAFASAGVGFAMRDGTQARLEREALRLGALLDAARAEAQVSGVPTRWRVTPQGFQFEPDMLLSEPSPQNQWLDPDTRAQVVLAPTDGLPGAALSQTEAAASLLLGPDAIIAPQVIELYAQDQPRQRVRLATDGVRPFALQVGAP